MNDFVIKPYAFVLDCKAPRALADFYCKLLDWVIPYEDDYCVVAAHPTAKQGEYPGISFQRNDDYVPPVWPEEPGAQQQMAHLDFAVSDPEKAVRHAINCGAKVADTQFSKQWTVMLDPEGHPFCLCPFTFE